MAGLPKSVLFLLTAMGMAVVAAFAVAAEDLQTDSVVLPPVNVQTPSNILQPVFDLIDSNLSADPTDTANLKVLFENAITLTLLSPEQAVAMLELVQWSTLTDAEALANVAAALQTILADLISGALTEDPVIALTRLLNELATPAGTLNAIGKAGASEEILDQVSSLVARGVPPGVLVRITKDGLRSGLSMEDIAAQLDAVAAAIEEGTDVAWGQLANDVTDKGENKHQDQEQNLNIEGSEEPEQEANEHGNGNAAEADNPGQGQGKGKDKGKDK